MNYNIYEELSKLNESTDSKNFEHIVEEALNTCAEALVQDICESLDADFDYISDTTNLNFNPDTVLRSIKDGNVNQFISMVVKNYIDIQKSKAADTPVEKAKEFKGVFADYDDDGNLIPDEERPEPVSKLKDSKAWRYTVDHLADKE